jgi:hypothetical protein
MPEHEARRRAVYDHDKEEPRPAGRRRQVADWGVGEEIFDHMPARRFERRPHRDILRGDVHDGRRTIVIETGDDEVPADRRAAVDEEFASRKEALKAREADDELWAGDEPFADRRATAAPAPETDETGDEPVQDAPGRNDEIAQSVPTTSDEGIVRGGQAGRRTVKIGGRPAEFYGPPARARHRPPRTMHERLGPRPERIAAWAFALGILLILIAVATANAAIPG